METLLLGPAAAAFAIVLVIASASARSPDMETALRACAVAIPLSVAAYMFEQTRRSSPFAPLRALWNLIYMALGNVAQILLVAAVYYLIRSMDQTAALWFLRVALVTYFAFIVMFIPRFFKRGSPNQPLQPTRAAGPNDQREPQGGGPRG